MFQMSNLFAGMGYNVWHIYKEFKFDVNRGYGGQMSEHVYCYTWYSSTIEFQYSVHETENGKLVGLTAQVLPYCVHWCSWTVV